MSYDHSGKSLLARFRGLLGHRSRALCVGAFLIGSAFGGIPIRPEEIEEHMQIMSRAQIVQVLEQKQKPSGDPPNSDGDIGLRKAPEHPLSRIDS